MTASAAELALRHAVRMSCTAHPAAHQVIVACSGGPDSVALAAAAAWEQGHGGPDVRAIVIDHQVHPDSGEISARAAQACRVLGLEAEVVQVTVGSAGGFEAAARRARYDALEQAAERYRADAVLLGHTRDDQAETVLLRLLRGSGARSLAAMRPIQGRWRRPFLHLSRTDVHDAAREIAARTGITLWHDPHNDDPNFARVQVRQLLASWSMGDTATLGLARSAALLADDADLLDDLASDAATGCIIDSEVEIAALDALPRALRTRIIRQWLLEQGSPPGDLNFDHVVAVDALVTNWHGQGPLPMPGDISVTRGYGRLRVSRTLEES